MSGKLYGISAAGRACRMLPVRAVSQLLLLKVLGLWYAGALAAETIETVAFGSCLRQWKPQPIWQSIVASRPDVFLFIGDNVYADTTDMDEMHTAYARLGAQPGYRELKTICPIHATWDNHDYGANDAGAEYPMRAQSQQVFMDFFGVPPDAAPRQRAGVYDVHWYGPPGRQVQIILLDTRYFRSPLQPAPANWTCPRVNYAPNTNPQATLLGKEQWTWLAEQLRQPDKLRIIASSIQVIPDEHCFEKWSNFPLERERLLATIRESAAGGVVLISGDRHLAEISRLDASYVGYPLYELTSSGMNSARAGRGESNRHRVTMENFRGDNFGVIEIDWSGTSARLSLQVRDVEGSIVQQHDIDLVELTVTSGRIPG